MPSRAALCGWLEERKGSAQGSYCLSNGEGNAVPQYRQGAELTLMGKWEVGAIPRPERKGEGPGRTCTRKSKLRGGH